MKKKTVENQLVLDIAVVLAAAVVVAVAAAVVLAFAVEVVSIVGLVGNLAINCYNLQQMMAAVAPLVVGCLFWACEGLSASWLL